MKKVTMEDIANAVGVSKVTVSKALAGKDGVGPELSVRIKEIALKMGYQYHTSGKEANALKLILILASEVFLEEDENFYTNLFKGIHFLLAQQGYTGVLKVISKEDENIPLPYLCQGEEVEGLIVLGQLSERYCRLLSKLSKPIVLVDFYYRKIQLDAVLADNVYAMYEATNYLIDLGHKSIGFVGNVRYTNNIQDRYLGYQKALLEHSLPILSEYLIEDRSDIGELKPLHLPNSLPTAFVCNCDLAAKRLIEYLKEKEIEVPKDVSVIGFDDVWHSVMSIPQITTVRVKRNEMAQYTVGRLLELMEDAKRGQISFPRRIPVATDIIERSSVSRV